jgi:DNA polymerase-3 subunit beta
MRNITDKEITSDKRKIKYVGLLAEDYPNTNSIQYNDELFTVSKDTFLDITKVKYACSTLETRPILTGVCFDNKMSVATDSHRLAKKEITFDNNINQNFVIPKYALDHIEKFQNKKVSGDIQVIAATSEINNQINYKNVKFVFDNIEMQVKTINGNYPDLSRIIPQNFKTQYTINKSKLIEELKLMVELNEIIVIKHCQDNINIYTKTSDKRNTFESNLNVKYVNKDEMEYIGFNAKFAIEALERLEGEYVTFKYTGNTSPFMINEETLILPIRMNNVYDYVA